MAASLEKIKRKRLPEENVQTIDGFKNFIGNDRSMIAVKRLAAKAAKNRFNVMLTGRKRYR